MIFRKTNILLNIALALLALAAHGLQVEGRDTLRNTGSASVGMGRINSDSIDHSHHQLLSEGWSNPKTWSFGSGTNDAKNEDGMKQLDQISRSHDDDDDDDYYYPTTSTAPYDDDDDYDDDADDDDYYSPAVKQINPRSLQISGLDIEILDGIDIGDIDGIDIGDVGVPGSINENADGSWTVEGSGLDVWGSNDEFYYANIEKFGDTILELRVDSFDASDGWAKGGMMIRDTLEPGSPYYSLFRTGSRRMAIQWRENLGGASQRTMVRSLQRTPVWIQIKKVGNQFTMQYRHAIVNDWIAFGGARTIDFSSDVFHVGIAVTSKSDSALATLEAGGLKTSVGGTFNEVSFSTNVVSYIEACKCDGVSFVCNTDDLVPNSPLIVCIKSVSSDLVIDFLDSMSVTQGDLDMAVIKNRTAVFTSFTALQYVSDENGVVVSTRVPANVFDYASEGSVINITGGIVMKYPDSGRNLNTDLDAFMEPSFQIQVTLQSELAFEEETIETSSNSAANVAIRKGVIGPVMLLAWANVMW